ncbi:MAG TPA: PilC/PilY family type IV pilus protein [Candidatus Competibacter sp.]|nr:PilC/PilY family type IV pilus protein [Candidatus Competibacter sp.]
MLVMGRDHKLYYEAYNDASDVNQDGEIDVGYKPNLTQNGKALDYYGYFDSYKCYSYSSGVFQPITMTQAQIQGRRDSRTKTCSSGWSGDFLNYLTTSRIDAIRRVLYGGYRYTDSTTETVLERSRIPQDAHSWGKEYTSIAHDGYNISEYAPLSLPATGTRHLFANTTLQNDTSQLPLLRVLTNSNFRVWNWLSIERPVAGDQCVSGITTGGSEIRTNCAVTGSTFWEKVPSQYFTNLTQTTYDLRQGGSTDVNVAHPNNHTEFTQMVTTYATTANRFGSGPASKIDGSGNPFGRSDDYLTVFTGQILIPAGGTYTFAVDGDDAVEVLIDGTAVAGYYGAHAACSCQTYSGTITLTAGSHTIEFRQEENAGSDSYYLWWQRTIPTSTLTDYTVRVKACVSGLLEPECKGYPESSPTVYKPTGLLHEYGETDRMAFGLLTGSFKKHLSGGLLRKNISSFTNEINSTTGQFLAPGSAGSIVRTIDNIRIVGFRGTYAYNDGGCGVPMVTAMQEGRCAMWGNPIAEMMYEGLRYFAGKTSPTTAYAVTAGEFDGFNTADNLNLPKPTWTDPFRAENQGGYPYCSKPFEVVIADIPSFDTDQLPGVNTNFGTGIGSDIGSLSVSSIGETIWDEEEGGTKNIFIGQSGSVYDTAPTPKSVDSFGDIRGLSPEEPTRQGGYYAASVAYFGKTTGVRQITVGTGNPHLVTTDTFGVALSSPLPSIEIPTPSYNDANKKIITVVPFAKSVSGSGISATQGQFQPTNTIVDFYVETIANTGAGNLDATVNGGRPYIKFRLNYEDSEYGSDHDMDAIVTYTFSVNASGQLVVNLSSDYAAGGVIQHMGYVISGTTADGVYLEVRDTDTAATSDPDYFLDTPPTFVGIPPAPSTTAGWDDNAALPLTATRTFTAGVNASTASLIPHDPLWYAAKWGGFIDADSNDLPDQDKEWDKDGDGKPDNYFLVTNAGKLKEQLRDTFEQIISRTGSAASVAVNSGSLFAGSRVYQARFKSGVWNGEVRALLVDPATGQIQLDADGKPQRDWRTQDATNQLAPNDRQILTYKPSNGNGIAFRWPSSVPTSSPTALDPAQISALDGSDNQGALRLAYLRGDASNEDQFRKRIDVDEDTNQVIRNTLGDIVNSNPFYVGPPDAGYPFGNYQTFADARLNRRPMVYVGANDGMLHGFDANTGKEVFAYVPSELYPKLNALTQLSYAQQHQFYVDASPTALDVQFSDESWHTVLVGGLRAGGLSYFALDVTEAGTVDSNGNVTDPGSLTEANADSVVLWEFKDPDLGLTFSQPSLVRRSDHDTNLDNNPWVAVFGNGYNSNNPNKPVTVPATPTTTAVLFVVNVENGSIIRKIDLREGLGLSTPSVVDGDGDGIADFIYAGDLTGNLWRFDIRNPNPNNWTYAKLFTAKDASNNVQPITAAPQVTRHPKLNANTDSSTRLEEFTYMVLFGTGKYLGATDVSSTSRQTFYGIWDDMDAGSCVGVAFGVVTTACFNRANLQAQVFCPGNPVDPTCQFAGTSGTVTSTGSITVDGKTFRITSANCVEYGALPADKQCGTDSVTGLPKDQQRGWYLDLKEAGERVPGDPLVVGSRVIFTSILPDPDPCKFGGTSWVNILDAVTGKRLSTSFLGVNNSTVPVTETSTGFAPSSAQIDSIASAPTAMKAPDLKKTMIYVSTSEGGVVDLPIVDSEIGRQSWRQVEFQ